MTDHLNILRQEEDTLTIEWKTRVICDDYLTNNKIKTFGVIIVRVIFFDQGSWWTNLFFLKTVSNSVTKGRCITSSKECQWKAKNSTSFLLLPKTRFPSFLDLIRLCLKPCSFRSIWRAGMFHQTEQEFSFRTRSQKDSMSCGLFALNHTWSIKQGSSCGAQFRTWRKSDWLLRSFKSCLFSLSFRWICFLSGGNLWLESAK